MRRHRFFLALPAFLAVAALCSSSVRADQVQIDPRQPDPSYVKSESLTVGTPVAAYFGTLGPTPSSYSPVRAILINVTVAGDVKLQLTDGNNITLSALPVGTYILPLQVIQVISSGTTATATYWDLG